ncbi:MAG: hypothetical protein HYX74_12035 [Acidobacteria bacterium]|nr:hypothetical protein [Acidobacteriota bacterium]
MTEELKSAYQRALEKLKEQGIDEPVESVTEEQKSEIVKIRNLYKSKIAELEIAKQADTMKAITAQNYEQLEKIQQNFVSERARLEQELESKLADIRSGKW